MSGALMAQAGSYPNFGVISATTQTANSTTMPVPSIARNGDILIYFFASDTQTMNVPTGFTNGASTGTNANLGWAYLRITTSTVPSTISGLQNARANEDVHGLLVVRGLTLTGLLTGTSGQLGTSSNTRIASSVTGLTSTLTYLVIAATSLEDTVTTLSSAPANYTTAFTQAGLGGNGNSSTVSVAYRVLTGVTATGTASFVFGASDIGAFVHFAFRIP